MKILIKVLTVFLSLGLLIGAASAQTKSSATITQAITPVAVAATVTLKSSGTSTGPNAYTAPLGTTLTYNGSVTCPGSTAAGTVTFVGLTGTQTVTLGSGGTFICTETPTAVVPATSVTATFNSSNAAVCY